MSNRLNGSGALNYMGVNAPQPPNLITSKRRPTTTDGAGFPLGTLWLIPQADITNTITPQREEWVLVGAQQNIFIWERVTGSGSQDLAIHQVVLGTGGPTLTTVPNGSTGQVLTSQGSTADPIWKGTGGGGHISVINTQVFTTPGAGTYTPTAGMVYCTVECVGGGMSTGFVGPDLGETDIGGSSAAYCKKTLSAAQVGVSQAIVVGAGGVPNNDAQVRANSGGNTTFGSFMTAGGGIAGGTNLYGSHGGVATGGDININGQTIGFFQQTMATDTFYPNGGSTIYGFGGQGIFGNTNPNSFLVNPTLATGYGSGPSSLARNTGGGGISAAWNGMGGIIIITEYIN